MLNIYLKLLIRIVRIIQPFSPFIASLFARQLWSLPIRKQHPWPSTFTQFDLMTRHGKVRVYKYGHGTPIWLIHGWSGAGSDFRLMMQRFSEQGLSTVSFDFPGHGFTDTQPMSLNKLIETFEDIAMIMLPPAHIVCHGTGASTVIGSQWFKKYNGHLTLISPSMSYEGALNGIANNYKIKSKVQENHLKDTSPSERLRMGKYNTPIKLCKFRGRLSIIHDKFDTVHPYDVSKDFSQQHDFPLVTTQNISHQKMLMSKSVYRYLKQHCLHSMAS